MAKYGIGELEVLAISQMEEQILAKNLLLLEFVIYKYA